MYSILYLFLKEAVEKDLLLQAKPHVNDGTFVPRAKCCQAGRPRVWYLGEKQQFEKARVLYGAQKVLILVRRLGMPYSDLVNQRGIPVLFCVKYLLSRAASFIENSSKVLIDTKLGPCKGEA